MRPSATLPLERHRERERHDGRRVEPEVAYRLAAARFDDAHAARIVDREVAAVGRERVERRRRSRRARARCPGIRHTIDSPAGVSAGSAPRAANESAAPSTAAQASAAPIPLFVLMLRVPAAQPSAASSSSLRELQLDAVAGGIAKEKLLWPVSGTCAVRYSMPSAASRSSNSRWPVQSNDAWLNVPETGASQTLARVRFAEMQHGPLARVEPIAEAAKRRARADREPDDVAIERAELVEQRARRAQVVMIERADRHAASARARRAGSRASRRAAHRSRIPRRP